MQRLLLDTHALIWWFFDPEKLSSRAKDAILNVHAETRVSAVSLWEIATKHKRGKLPHVAPLIDDPALIERAGFVPLPITGEHALRAGALSLHHGDPFDRLLIGQSLTENLTLVSNEALFDRYGVQRLWR